MMDGIEFQCSKVTDEGQTGWPEDSLSITRARMHSIAPPGLVHDGLEVFPPLPWRATVFRPSGTYGGDQFAKTGEGNDPIGKDNRRIALTDVRVIFDNLQGFP